MNDRTPVEKKSLILMVDDNVSNLQALGNMLEKRYKTAIALDGFATLAFVKKKLPDLILLDITMPGLSGYEVCSRLKEDAKTKEIPIIFLSAHKDVEDKIKAFSLGGVDYITKPFESEEVLVRVATHVNMREMQNRLESQNIMLQKEIIERKRAGEERLHLQRRLQQSQKAESLGRMAGAVAHHFNNLLFVVSGNLELIKDDLPSPSETIDNLNEVEKAIEKAVDLSKLMLTYVGQGIGENSLLDLSQEVSRAVFLIEEAIPDNITLDRKFMHSLPAVTIGPDDIRRIVMNLVENAWEAMDGQTGNVRIATGKISCDRTYLEQAVWFEACEPGEYVYLEVADKGCGMDPETIEQMFDPFFTEKFTGRGLGLASVAGIVRSNRGAITVSSKPGAGAVVRVLFPAAQKTNHTFDTVTDAGTKIPEVKVRGIVLLVEDEDMVRKVCKNMLERMDFKVLSAAGGTEAVEIFNEMKKEIVCVLCDLSMPDMNGWETMIAIREIQSKIPFILASGYDEAIAMRGHHTDLPQAFIQKPYQRTGLRTALVKALGSKELSNTKYMHMTDR